MNEKNNFTTVNTACILTLWLHLKTYKLAMGDSPEETNLSRFSIKFDLIFFHYYFARHDTIEQVSKVFKVQTYYKTLINHVP